MDATSVGINLLLLHQPSRRGPVCAVGQLWGLPDQEYFSFVVMILIVAEAVVAFLVGDLLSSGG